MGITIQKANEKVMQAIKTNASSHISEEKKKQASLEAIDAVRKSDKKWILF